LKRRIPRSVAVLGLALLAALPSTPAPPVDAAPADDPGTQRKEMVQQLRQRGITKPEVLAAMEFVPRHLFIPDAVRAEAYEDRALKLSGDRTIYQPYLVALMTSLLDLERGDKVLEVGTGTGYHAAVLSRIAREVYSMEIDPTIASQANKRLQVMGYQNIAVRTGDGYQGWPDKAPFDAIILSAAPPRVPERLLKQLKVGGRMVLPVGGFFQDLLVITKTADGIEKRTIIPVRLSPMQGQIRNEP
jgi:protein-L-isoaspartate(D-aspartate) O-methyltransferase